MMKTLALLSVAILGAAPALAGAQCELLKSQLADCQSKNADISRHAFNIKCVRELLGAEQKSNACGNEDRAARDAIGAAAWAAIKQQAIDLRNANCVRNGVDTCK